VKYLTTITSVLFITIWVSTVGITEEKTVVEESPLAAETTQSNDVQNDRLQKPSAQLSSLAEITPGPTITLHDALERARLRNMDLAVANLEVDKARAKLSGAWGLIHPVIMGKLDYTHMDHEDTVDLASSFQPLLNAMGIQLPPGTNLGDPLLTNTQDKLTGSVEAIFPLVNVQNWLTIKVARQGVTVAELSIEHVQRQILLGVAQAYFIALMTRDLIDFFHSQVVSTEEHLEIAQACFNEGSGMRIDVIRADTDLEQARQSLLSAQLAFDNARDALGNLIGIDGLPLPSSTTPHFEDISNQVEQMERKAITIRIDIKTQTAIIEMRDRQLDASRMQFVPTLDLAAQGSYQFTEMADMGSDDRSRWAVMLSLTVPIYDRFRYSDLDEKGVALRQATLSLANIEQKATLAVRKLSRDYATALTAVAAAEKQADLAKEGLGLVEVSFRVGAGTSLDVTQARQTYIAAGLNLATLQFKAQLSLLNLLDAVGQDLSASVKEET
jgi:outer membrane protein TolC